MQDFSFIKPLFPSSSYLGVHALIIWFIYNTNLIGFRCYHQKVWALLYFINYFKFKKILLVLNFHTIKLYSNIIPFHLMFYKNYSMIWLICVIT